MAKAFSSGLSSVLSGGADTIVARATAAGAGALAVIRVSGPETERLAGLLCPEVDMGAPWRARVVQLHDLDGQSIEDAIAIPYRAPRSYTGEDMLELLVHGSPWIIERVLETMVSAGGRCAGPGEFTQRAVANGKMDLVQAEAVHEVIQAETLWQARLAREQLHGGLSREFQALKEKLILFLAEVEGSLDFEEQGAVVDHDALERAQEDCVSGVEALLHTEAAGVRVREGARVVIIGAPNAGKSTLFNTLLLRERAIVTEAPGTTRDVLEADLEIGGLPVVLVDTAGIREANEPAEAEGIRRAEKEMDRADVILELFPAGQGERAAGSRQEERRITIISKVDLAGVTGDGVLGISCVTGEGLDRLRKEIHERISAPLGSMTGKVAVNARHRGALVRAQRQLKGILSLPREVAALEIRSAAKILDELLGSVDDQEVLDSIFSTFCVGK